MSDKTKTIEGLMGELREASQARRESDERQAEMDRCQRELIYALARRGVSYADIGRVAGISRGRVQQIDVDSAGRARA